MKEISFEWAENKNKTNQRKHDVSFEEAQYVFYDQNARLIHDPEHSVEEDRYIILGFGSKSRLLVVMHAYREDDEVIRIISARKATKKETAYYQRKKYEK